MWFGARLLQAEPITGRAPTTSCAWRALPSRWRKARGSAGRAGRGPPPGPPVRPRPPRAARALLTSSNRRPVSPPSLGRRSARSPTTCTPRRRSSAISTSAWPRAHGRCSAGSRSGRGSATASLGRRPCSTTNRCCSWLSFGTTSALSLRTTSTSAAPNETLRSARLAPCHRSGGSPVAAANRSSRQRALAPRGGTVTTRIRAWGITVPQASSTRRRSWRIQNAVASGTPEISRSRTAAMNSGQGVVLPVMMFCCQAETAVRAMSRTPTTTCSWCRPRLRATLRTCRGRASPSSSSEITTLGPS